MKMVRDSDVSTSLLEPAPATRAASTAQAAAPRTLVIVPAYNESATLRGVARAIRAEAPGADILVIDDGSTDDSSGIARREDAVVIRHPFNLGIGGAVQTGFIYALEHGYDFMVQVDGDGQHDPGQIGVLFEAMAEQPAVDMVCGSRFLSPERRYPAPISRRTGIHIFAFLLSSGSASATRPPAFASTTAARSSSSPATTRTTTPRSRPSSCCTSTGCACARRRCGCTSAAAASRRSGPASRRTT
jgi:GT2 family glycosyltransferase